MIRFLVGFAILITIIIVGISVYLQPNDIASCNNVITGTGPCQKVDAVVAISGGDTNARTDEAIQLYKDGWTSTLIFAGAAQDKSGPSNASVMRDRAIDAGVSASDIFIDEQSETTKQNAQNTQSILQSQNSKTIILVTSGYHQRRAMLEFAKYNPDVTVYNKPVSNDKDWSFWWWTSPRGWTLAVTELFKIVALNFEGTK